MINMSLKARYINMPFCHWSAKFSSPFLLPLDLFLKCKHFPSVPQASFISHELVWNSTLFTEINSVTAFLPPLHLMTKYGHDSTPIYAARFLRGPEMKTRLKKLDPFFFLFGQLVSHLLLVQRQKFIPSIIALLIKHFQALASAPQSLQLMRQNIYSSANQHRIDVV